MKPIGIVLVIAIILVAAMIVLYFLGKKAQKKKEEQDEQMKAAAQTVTMLIIDKKRMKMKDAGLPSQVMEQANKLMQRAKLPIVKAKVGPRVMTLIADEQIYDDIPVKKEVKATVSGLYKIKQDIPIPRICKSCYKIPKNLLQELRHLATSFQSLSTFFLICVSIF